MEERTIICAECGQTVHVTDEGFVYAHYNTFGYRCENSGLNIGRPSNYANREKAQREEVEAL